MRSIKVSGKTIDEAIFKGLNELEISIDEVDVEIIQNETKGVFGIGAKPAVVRLTERENSFSKIVGDVMRGEPEKRPTPPPRPRQEHRDRQPAPARQAPPAVPANGAPAERKPLQRKGTPAPSKPAEPAARQAVQRPAPDGNKSEDLRSQAKPQEPTADVDAKPREQARPEVKKELKTGLLSPDIIQELQSGSVDVEALERRNATPSAQRTAPRQSSYRQNNRPSSPRYERGERNFRNGGGERNDRRPYRGSDNRRQASGQSRGYGAHAGRSTPPVRDNIQYSSDLALETPAAIFLNGLLSRMGIEARVLCANHDDGLRLKIESAASERVIGRRGETLNSLQYLVSLNANRGRGEEDPYVRVTVDTEGYRARREASLVRLAWGKASEVRRTGKPFKLDPMNPYERRVIHSALQEHRFVTTHSEGEEPMRCVVVAPKGSEQP